MTGDAPTTTFVTGAAGFIGTALVKVLKGPWLSSARTRTHANRVVVSMRRSRLRQSLAVADKPLRDEFR